MTAIQKYEHACSIENADKFAAWIKDRGGVAIWESVNLSDPGKSWSTPATIRKGDCQGQTGDEIIPYPKPTWQAADTPKIITDPALIEVYEPKEHKRFHVALRMGAQGLTLKCTDASSARIRREVKKAGEGAYYVFDYETQEAVIFATETIGSLKEWIEKHGK